MASSPKQQGRVRQTRPTKLTGPSEGVKRFFLTSAQNNTSVFKAAWDNIQALCVHYDAELIVSPYTYHKKYWSQSGEIKPGSDTKEDYEETFWDKAVEPYLRLDHLQLGKSLIFCAGMNILPTAVNPLSGLELHTGRASAVYPHAKMQLTSVASGKFEGTKLMFTTGTVTKRNYLQKKIGQTAEPHHCYGGLIVEIDTDGSFFVRQVQADEKGVIHDLDLRVAGGVVYTDNPIEAITWGDIHAYKMDPTVAEACWGDGGMLDTLQPKYQFFHDVFDMYARNHHERKSPHRMFERRLLGIDEVWKEAAITADFLKKADRPWCKGIAVKSNHDDAFERWLQSTDCLLMMDTANIVLWHEGNLAWFHEAALNNKRFLPIEWLLQREGAPKSIQFLREDESFIICHDEHGGIECGMHGHLGVNGAKGNLRSFSKTGRRSNTADKHCAGIFNGAYQSGVSGKLDMWYNKGLSTWSQSHILTYPNSMRSIVTMWKGRWRG
jgi:hypothetical protein